MSSDNNGTKKMRHTDQPRTVARPAGLAVHDLNGVKASKVLNVTNRLLEVVKVGRRGVVDVLSLPVSECVHKTLIN